MGRTSAYDTHIGRYYVPFDGERCGYKLVIVNTLSKTIIFIYQMKIKLKILLLQRL